MIYCMKCGMELNEGTTFCPKCGKVIGSAAPQRQYFESENKTSSTAATVLGVLSLICWLLPIIGYPVTIAGIIVGIMSWQKGEDATAGTVMSSIGLALTIINSIAGAVMWTNMFM